MDDPSEIEILRAERAAGLARIAYLEDMIIDMGIAQKDATVSDALFRQGARTVIEHALAYDPTTITAIDADIERHRRALATLHETAGTSYVPELILADHATAIGYMHEQIKRATWARARLLRGENRPRTLEAPLDMPGPWPLRARRATT